MKIFIELGQRVDTIGTLSTEKKIVEAKALRDWTAQDLVLMKDGIAEYLQSIIDKPADILVIFETDGNRDMAKSVPLPAGSKVTALLNHIVSEYGLPSITDVKEIKKLNRKTGGYLPVRNNDLLIDGEEYSIKLRERPITVEYTDTQGVTHQIVQNVTYENSIDDFIENLYKVADIIEAKSDGTYRNLELKYQSGQRLEEGDGKETLQQYIDAQIPSSGYTLMSALDNLPWYDDRMEGSFLTNYYGDGSPGLKLVMDEEEEEELSEEEEDVE